MCDWESFHSSSTYFRFLWEKICGRQTKFSFCSYIPASDLCLLRPNSLDRIHPSSATFGYIRRWAGLAARTRCNDCRSRDASSACQVRWSSQSFVLELSSAEWRAPWTAGVSFSHLERGKKEAGESSLHYLSSLLSFALKKRFPWKVDTCSISIPSVCYAEWNKRKSILRQSTPECLCFWSYLLYFVSKVVDIYWTDKHVNTHSKFECMWKGDSYNI